MNLIIYYLITIFPIILILRTYFPNSTGSEILKFKPSYLRYDWRLICGVLFYSVLLSISFETAADYVWYYGHYVSEVRGVEDEWGSGREIGYQILVKYLSKISDNPNLLFFFFAVINMLVWTKVASLYRSAAPFIILAWFTFMFTLSLNLYRQYFAMASIMAAFYAFNVKDGSLLENKKKLLNIGACLLLAFSFHTSSLIAILYFAFILYLTRYKINKNIIIIVVIVTTVSSTTILSSYINSFSNFVTVAQSITDRSYEFSAMLESRWEESRMIYIFMICHIVYIIYADKYLSIDKNYRLIYYGMALSFILMPLTNQEILMRLRLYIDCVMVVGVGLTLFFSYNKVKKIHINPLTLSFFTEFVYKMFNLYNLGIEYPLTIKF